MDQKETKIVGSEQMSLIIDQWNAAQTAGRQELAERLLNTARKYFGDALDIKILEALHPADWKPSEENLLLWKQIKVAAEEESHICDPHPCLTCSTEAVNLMILAFGIEDYAYMLRQTNRLLVLYPDDIVALLFRVRARIYLLMEIENEMTDDSTARLSLADMRRIRELITKLTDNQIYCFRPYRDDPTLIDQTTKKEHDLIFIQALVRKPEQENDLAGCSQPPDASIEVQEFNDILDGLNPIIGVLLAAVNRFEEALPLLTQGFVTACKIYNAEAIVALGQQISYILAAAAPFSSDVFELDEILPCLTQRLASETDEENNAVLLQLLILSLWEMDKQPDNFKLREPMDKVLELLKTELQRAEQEDNVKLILYLISTIGILYFRTARSTDALPYLIEGLRFLASYDAQNEPEYFNLMKFYNRCLFDLDVKQQDTVEQMDAALVSLKTGLQGAEAEQAEDATLLASMVLLTGRTLLKFQRFEEAVHFLKGEIENPVFTRADEGLQTQIIEIFCGCLRYCWMHCWERERVISLLQELVEWAGTDGARLAIFQKISTTFQRLSL